MITHGGTLEVFFIYISNNLKELIAIKIGLNVIVRDPEHTGALGLKYIHKMTLQSSTEWCKYKFNTRKKEYSTRRMKVGYKHRSICISSYMRPCTLRRKYTTLRILHQKTPHIFILLWNRKTITKHFAHPLICKDCFGRVPYSFITSEIYSPHDLQDNLSLVFWLRTLSTDAVLAYSSRFQPLQNRYDYQES